LSEVSIGDVPLVSGRADVTIARTAARREFPKALAAGVTVAAEREVGQ